MPEPKIVLDEDDIRRTLVRIAHEVVEKNNGRPVALVGIHRRGAYLATRLHQLVCDLLDEEVPLGDIDISFYRDDLSLRNPDPAVHSSNLSFRLEDYTVVLVDDVLYTGRTIRAAMNELFDYGRPASIRLAALIDRGGRELPIAAQWIADTIEAPDGMGIELKRDERGRLSLAWYEKSAPDVA